MILAALVLAATADLSVIQTTPSKAAVVYDETFTVTTRVRNGGPDAAENVRVTIGSNATTFLLGIAAPAGWTCDAVPRYATALACRAATMAAASEAQFTLTLTSPQPSAMTFRVGASIASDSTDPQRTNNLLEQVMGLTAAPRSHELRLTGAAAENPVPQGGEVRLQVDVRNDGPDLARNVLVLLTGDVPFAATGAGWTCSGTTCTRPELPAGTIAPIDVRATAPSADTEISFAAFVRAEQGLDNNRLDNELRVTVGVGSVESWERLLIPVAVASLPGSGGALWTTDLAGLILADAVPEIVPTACELIIVICPIAPLPVRRQFDLFEHLIVGDSPGGQFLYVRPEDASKLRLNARIRDAARIEQTAGAEMPIVRDSAFTSGTVALLNIPVAPQYRHTLRIYDDAARNGARVAIRIYGGNGSEPLINIVRTLTVLDTRTTTTAQLPVHPGYAQAELGQLASVAGFESLRVEVEPLDPGVRVWAFVSIVNNETHHVTVVTPQ